MHVKRFVSVVQRRIIEGDDNLLRVVEPLFAIETHMSMEERLRLLAVAQGLPQGFTACEIGSYLGASTTFLAVGASARGGTLHCVDTWDNRAMGVETACDTYAAFLRNTEPFRDRITIHRGESSAMAAAVPQLLDLLFIDGDHAYTTVKSDLVLYLPKLKPGGLLLLHDFDYPEVRQACAESLAGRPTVDLGLTHTLKAFQMLGPQH